MEQVYSGHTCADATLTDSFFDLNASMDDIINDLLKKVFNGKIGAGEIDEATWQANTDELWKAIQEGWGKLPGFDSQLQLALLQLRSNANWFGIFKNHANVFDLVTLFTKENPPTFNDYKKLAQPTMDKYYDAWLKAEYNYATRAASAAAQWHTFVAEGGKLEYFTIGDGRVREAHVGLNGTIRPIDDPFWSTHYPPNGWNCRCYVRRRPETTDNVDPVSVPENLPMFNNNVGITSQIFTADHPFIAQLSSFQADLLTQLAQASTIKFERRYIKGQLTQHLPGTSVTVQFGEFGAKDVTFTVSSLKEAVNQPHKHQQEKNQALLNIAELMNDAQYIKAIENLGRDRNVLQFHYFLTTIANEPSYIVMKEMVSGEFVFYTIVDNIK